MIKNWKVQPLHLACIHSLINNKKLSRTRKDRIQQYNLIAIIIQVFSAIIISIIIRDLYLITIRIFKVPNSLIIKEVQLPKCSISNNKWW